MPAVYLWVNLSGIDESIKRFESAISVELASALGQVQRLVADNAQADHPYEDQTGTLTGSIGPGDVNGSVYDDNLRGLVVASAYYGKYVDSRTEPYERKDGGFTPPLAFLLPAFERTEDESYALIDHALSEAIDLAGWSK